MACANRPFYFQADVGNGLPISPRGLPVSSGNDWRDINGKRHPEGRLKTLTALNSRSGLWGTV